MNVSVKSADKVIPEYSLTGDLLAYLRCGLQYRMYSRGKLPPSVPVQQWFGEFIHGSLEEAFARWNEEQTNPDAAYSGISNWTWERQLKPIELAVYERLRARGLPPPPRLLYENLRREKFDEATQQDRGIASLRFEKAISTWGAHLFPLIDSAEVRLRGSAPMAEDARDRATRFSVTGIVDVLTSVRLRQAPSNNAIIRRLRDNAEIREAMDSSSEPFEIIVDYKGMRRPAVNDPSWEHQAWQLQTYAWLRRRQNPGARVLAGVLLYINELVPSETDLKLLVQDLASSQTDVVPALIDQGQLAHRDRHGTTSFVLDPNEEKMPSTTALSVPFREDRSFRLVEVSKDQSELALKQFTQTVGGIEKAVAKEVTNGDARSGWATNVDDRTCVACDFKYHCPAREGRDKPSIP